jgi:hypothetical protein
VCPFIVGCLNSPLPATAYVFECMSPCMNFYTSPCILGYVYTSEYCVCLCVSSFVYNCISLPKTVCMTVCSFAHLFQYLLCESVFVSASVFYVLGLCLCTLVCVSVCVCVCVYSHSL